MARTAFNIGIICGKLGGTDGVSLEVDKWIKVFTDSGHKVLTIAGIYITDVENVEKKDQYTLPDLRFDTEEQKSLERQCFPFIASGQVVKSSEKHSGRIIENIRQRGEEVAQEIYSLITENNIDVLIGENTNAMPMTLIGGMAVHILATKQRVATIFHHHDFWWERSRFGENRIESLLNEIMPSNDLGIEHSVLTSYSAHILRSLKRVEPLVIPNCEDYDNPPQHDDYAASFRKELGFSDDDILVIQPTRIVRRKRIEDSIELLGRLIRKYPQYKGRIQYIISLYQGDEPDNNYIEQIQEKAERMEVPLHLIAERVSSQRGKNKQGKKIFTNRDVLVNADLVTYLPIWEGFGNALLEAVAAKAPVVITTYLVYKTDIQTTGMDNIEIRDHYDKDGHLIIEEKVLDDIHDLLNNPERKKEMVKKNFEICKSEFGMTVLKKRLETMLEDYRFEIQASRKRIQKTKVNYSV